MSLPKYCRGCLKHKPPEGFTGTGVYSRCPKCTEAKARAMASRAALRTQPRPAA